MKCAFKIIGGPDDGLCAEFEDDVKPEVMANAAFIQFKEHQYRITAFDLKTGAGVLTW